MTGGCERSGVSLTVRVQTGLRAEVELRYVRARVLSGSVSCASLDDLDADGRAVDATDQEALRSGSFTVGEFRSLSRGTYTVHVLARRPGEGASPESGAILVERCVITSVSNDRVLRVPLTTDCINVTCPAPGGSPAFTECLGGRCVDPRCDPDDPSTADLCCDRATLGDECDLDPTLCRDSTDCEPTLSCSGSPSCEDGVCVEPEEDRCADGQFCDALANRCASLEEPPPDAGSGDASASLDAGMDGFVPTDAFEPADAFSPDAFVPTGIDAPFPDAFSPDAFSPDAFSPDAFSRDAFSPDAFSPDAFSRDAFSPDTPLVEAIDCGCPKRAP